MTRVKGQPTEYSNAERKTLFDVLEQVLPLQRISWIIVQTKYNEAHRKAAQEANEEVRRQTGELGTQQPVKRRRQSLRYFYNKMRKNVVLTKGNPTPPTLAARARKIKKLVLGKKACICELGGQVDEDSKEQILVKEEEGEQNLGEE